MVEWRPIPGYEDSYEVSNDGRVRSIDRIIWKLNPRSHDIRAFRHKGRELKAATRRQSGYKFVQLGIANPVNIHRLVALAFVPNPNNRPMVDHINGDRQNNDPSNLRWTTKSGNQANRHKTFTKAGLLGAHTTSREGGRQFQSKVILSGKKTYLGRFDTAEAAHVAYLAARENNFKEFYGKPSVAPDSDKRPALKVNGADALGALASAEDMV